jgi:hypothetical protein
MLKRKGVKYWYFIQRKIFVFFLIEIYHYPSFILSNTITHFTQIYVKVQIQNYHLEYVKKKLVIQQQQQNRFIIIIIVLNNLNKIGKMLIS